MRRIVTGSWSLAILSIAVANIFMPCVSCAVMLKRKVLENGLTAQNDFQSAANTLKSQFGIGKSNPTPDKDPFYGLNATPEELDKFAPGTILRKRPIYLTAFPGFDADELIGWQMAFVTTSPTGAKENMVATVAIPPKAGNRDKIVLQSPKASGANPGARTSYFLRQGSGSLTGSASEQIFMANYLDRGYIVVMTDAQGQHDAFGNGPVAGRAVLDTIRATLDFKELKLAPRDDVKVIPWGYSAGGLATMWAASLMQTYAPELSKNVIAFSMGGSPYSLRETAYSVNAGIGAGLILGVMRGLSNVHPDLAKWTDDHLTPGGKDKYKATLDGAFFNFMPPNVEADILGVKKEDQKPGQYGYFNIPDAIEDKIPAAILAENEILAQYNATKDTKFVPKTPMLIYCPIGDYVVPIQGLDKVVNTWVEQGATIAYRRIEMWKHVGGVFAYQSENVQWIADRFDGKPLDAKAGQLNSQNVNTLIDDASSQDVLGKGRVKELKNLADKLDEGKTKKDVWF